jgi:hypothetical protein
MRSWSIGGKVFTAYTRSEARALAKRFFGIKPKGRLPKGIVICEIKE